MLAFDIETLGRLHEKPLPPITCVCLYDGVNEYKLRFLKVPDDEFERNKQIMLECLDSADCLAGYNAVHFDLEYIQRFFQVSSERVQAWVLKCIDPFMAAKYILKNTCSLNYLLGLNGLGSKTGCGSDAIALALQEKWGLLLDYCLMDARLTYDLCNLPEIAFSAFLRGSLAPGMMLWRFRLLTTAATKKGGKKAAATTTVAEGNCGGVLFLATVEPFVFDAEQVVLVGTDD